MAELKTDAITKFKKATEELLYLITYYRAQIDDNNEFEGTKILNHNSIGQLYHEKIRNLRWSIGRELIQEVDENQMHGVEMAHYFNSLNIFFEDIAKEIKADWIIDATKLEQYKADFLRADDFNNLFTNKDFLSPILKKPFKSMLFDLLFGIREVKIKVDKHKKKAELIEKKVNYQNEDGTLHLTWPELQGKLTNREAALLAVYEGESITRDSGKLYQFWAFYSDRSHRIKIIEGAESESTAENKIKTFEKVLPLISDEVKRLRAEDELNHLKEHINQSK